jgi:zinc protease
MRSARGARAIARWLAAALVLSLVDIAPATAAGAAPAPVREEGNEVLRATLTNGLRVIIVRNALAPVVATSVNYLVGSAAAPAGFPGTAHALEHMMFRGSPGLTAEQLANIGSIMGGDFNANTRESLTQYLYTVPAEDLDVALHIEAVRMRGVLDTAAGWDQERGAIEQEVAQDLSNPDYVLYEKLRALAFAGTPYEHDALGTRPSFEATTAAMLKHFHDAWYAPNNAILIIVGNVQPRAALAQVKTLFGGIPARKLPQRPVVRPAPLTAAAFTLDTDRPNGSATLALRTPGLDSPDFPALEVLADVLSSHRFELYGLVPEGRALAAEFSLDPLPQAGLAYATVTFPAGADAGALESAVRAILERVVKDGVPAELVEAAKVQERRATEFQKNSIAGLASVWADAVALYGLPSPEADLARIEKVTVEDVNRVARRYLDLDHAITAVLQPQGGGAPISGGGFGGQETIDLGEAKPTALPAWAQSAVKRLDVPSLTATPVVSTLPNGLTLIVQPESVSNTVSILGHIRNRAEVQQPAGKEGVAGLLEQMLPYGSEKLDRLAFQRALDDIGAEERAGTDFGIEALAEYFDRAAELLADNELHPALPSAAMAALQPRLVQVVTARNRSPGYLTQRSLRTALFPAGDPSLREETPESVRALTLDDVQAYHRAVMRPDLTTIVVIGRISPEQARATITRYFGDWAAVGPKPATDLPTTPPNKPDRIAVPDASRVQDTVVLAQALPLKRSDPDYYPLELGSAVLGGGFYSTRLSIQMRKNAGLVYGVGSQLQAGRTRSVYMIRYASDPQNVARAEGIALHEVRSLQEAPPSQDELDRVKALLLRQIPLHEASVDGIAGGFLSRVELELPLDEPSFAAQRFIGITGPQVQAAFRKWIKAEEFVRVTQGPAPN